MHSDYLSSSIRQFNYYRGLAEKAMLQIPDDAFFHVTSQDGNSIAIIAKHLAGNMLSRWTDIFNTDGEKPWRNRDDEFELDHTDRQLVMDYWNQGWTCLFDTLNALTTEDLGRIIYIRNEGHTVLEAINRQLCHYSYHIGQIVLIAKISKGSTFESLSIPRNQSTQYNQQKFGEAPEIRHFTDKV